MAAIAKGLGVRFSAGAKVNFTGFGNLQLVSVNVNYPECPLNPHRAML
jgi:hypothetical protein